MKRGATVSCFLFLVSCFLFLGCKKDDGSSFKLTSTSYGNNQAIPAIHSRSGGNKSPQFSWVEPPDNTKSFVLIMHDPNASNWVHWAVTNIPASVSSIAENASASGNNSMPAGCMERSTDFSDYPDDNYQGPQPPDKHTYITTIYALNVETLSGSISFYAGSGDYYTKLIALMSGKIIDKATHTGTFTP